MAVAAQVDQYTGLFIKGSPEKSIQTCQQPCFKGLTSLNLYGSIKVLPSHVPNTSFCQVNCKIDLGNYLLI